MYNGNLLSNVVDHVDNIVIFGLKKKKYVKLLKKKMDDNMTGEL